MNSSTQIPPKQELPIRWQRELHKGETVYHSTMACHASRKFPDGKWIAEVRRETAGKLVRLPVKGYGSIKEAVDYVKSLRSPQPGQVTATRRGEPTVTDLYQFVTAHRQKRLSEKSKQAKAQRWRDYVAPEWGGMPLSRVTRRSAQEWVSAVEEACLSTES